MSFTSSAGNFTILFNDEQLGTLRLDRLYRDWRNASKDGAMAKADSFIDAQKLGYLDGMLVVVDVEQHGPSITRYRYRSVGRHFIDHLKVDPAGSYMDQHPESSFATQAMRACGLVVDTRRPIHARIDREIDGRAFTVEFLLLPLGGTEGQVATLLIGQIFTPA